MAHYAIYVRRWDHARHGFGRELRHGSVLSPAGEPNAKSNRERASTVGRRALRTVRSCDLVTAKWDPDYWYSTPVPSPTGVGLL